MICRTFIFFFLCYFSKHVLIQVQPDRYTSILKKGFNVKQMIDYSVEQILFIIFLIHFACYFVICWQSSSITDVALIDMLQRILLYKPVSVNFLWALGNLLIVEGLMWLCLMYIYPHLLSFYIWIHAHVLSTMYI